MVAGAQLQQDAPDHRGLPSLVGDVYTSSLCETRDRAASQHLQAKSAQGPPSPPWAAETADSTPGLQNS